MGNSLIFSRTCTCGKNLQKKILQLKIFYNLDNSNFKGPQKIVWIIESTVLIIRSQTKQVDYDSDKLELKLLVWVIVPTL